MVKSQSPKRGLDVSFQERRQPRLPAAKPMRAALEQPGEKVEAVPARQPVKTAAVPAVETVEPATSAKALQQGFRPNRD